MLRVIKRKQKIPILKTTTGLCPSRSYYSMLSTVYRLLWKWILIL